MRFRQSSTVIRAMALRNFSARAALAVDDLGELRLGGIEVFVNYTIIELVGVGHFGLGVGEATLDHDVGVLAAAAQAPFELLHRGRQDEDADAVRIEAAHLRRTLPVDLKDQVLPLLQGLADDALGSPVAIAVHQRVLEELAAI